MVNVKYSEPCPLAFARSWMIRWQCVISLICLLAVGCSGERAAVAPSPAAQSLNADILAAVRSMPRGGGYAADNAAEVRLAQSGIFRQGGALRVSAEGACPTFCSAACYIVLLRALRLRESRTAARLPAEVWHSLRVEPQHPDGYLTWGRVNANGPGLAKWAQDAGVGVSFTSPQAARPGDFLKFFHTPAIGVKERGHLVVFLGMVQREGSPHIRYWSANKPDGYGERIVPLAKMHHLIFTRITHPERITRILALPPLDSWLASMLTRSHSYSSVCKQLAL